MQSSSSVDEPMARNSGLPTNPDRSALIVSVVVGAAIGIGLGFFSMAGGWIAPIVGLVLGAVAGGLVGKYTIRRHHRQAAKDRALDREIGVIP